MFAKPRVRTPPQTGTHVTGGGVVVVVVVATTVTFIRFLLQSNDHTASPCHRGIRHEWFIRFCNEERPSALGNCFHWSLSLCSLSHSFSACLCRTSTTTRLGKQFPKRSNTSSDVHSSRRTGCATAFSCFLAYSFGCSCCCCCCCCCCCPFPSSLTLLSFSDAPAPFNSLTIDSWAWEDVPAVSLLLLFCDRFLLLPIICHHVQPQSFWIWVHLHMLKASYTKTSQEAKKILCCSGGGFHGQRQAKVCGNSRK